MKNSFKYILFLSLVTTFSINAFADVRVKARQTMSGQSYENTTYIKGKRQRTEQNLGGMQNVSITQCDLKRTIQLNPQTQVYIINSWEQDTTTPSTVKTSGNTTTEIKKGGVITTTITTKDTGETRKMFGYPARHLIITIETESSADACAPTKSKMVTDGWYIDAEFALDCDYADYRGYGAKNVRGGCQDKYEFKQVGATRRGYPVIEKMTVFDASGKETFTMTNEVIELSNTNLDAALFEIPNGWREVQDTQSLYTSMSSNNSNYNRTSQNSPTNNSGLSSTVRSKTTQTSQTLEPKKDGVVRIGLVGVNTASVGEGINAAELANAIQNGLGEYLKGTKVELVPLEAELQPAIDAEAKKKNAITFFTPRFRIKKAAAV